MYIKLKLVIQGMLYRGKKTQSKVHPTFSDLKCDLNRPPNLTIVMYGHDVFIYFSYSEVIEVIQEVK